MGSTADGPRTPEWKWIGRGVAILLGVLAAVVVDAPRVPEMERIRGVLNPLVSSGGRGGPYGIQVDFDDGDGNSGVASRWGIERWEVDAYFAQPEVFAERPRDAKDGAWRVQKTWWIILYSQYFWAKRLFFG